MSLKKENLFKKSKAKLAKKNKDKKKSTQSKVENVGETLLPEYKEKTDKKNTKNRKLKGMQVFGRSHAPHVMEFKGYEGVFGAGMVSGEIPGDKGGRGLTGALAASRAGTRSLGNQKDGDNEDTSREEKGRKWARKQEQGKARHHSRELESMTNIRTNSRSQGIQSNRVVTNQSMTVQGCMFKRAKVNQAK